jgi:lipopolysaccharide/colanic/teichoic acid biosynthesis glycosyltransferase
MAAKNLEGILEAGSGGTRPVNGISPDWRKRVYLRVKRMQDVLLSALALLVLSPILLLIALAVIIDDPKGGPMFSQVRCGQNGEAFRLYKFRSMCVGAEERLSALLPYNEMDGPVFKIRDDPRITRVGRFLRSTGLDELPQLINILRGDMSIVGPRPPLFREVQEYTPYQRQRLTVTPGLTCFWQVSPDRNSLSFDAWVEMDLRYIREQSWLLDWKLIFQTGRAVLRREGQ